MTNIDHVQSTNDVLKKENLVNETINNIHRFLFDILAFFSNYHINLIEEYCQEIQNVCGKDVCFFLFEIS